MGKGMRECDLVARHMSSALNYVFYSQFMQLLLFKCQNIYIHFWMTNHQ